MGLRDRRGRRDETITVEVLDERRDVMDVETIVVHDVVTIDGEVIEDTYDWYAQDADGNVWYFGEDTTAYEDGVASTEGAWEAGVGDAMPGIVMPATPAVSDTGYRQEYDPGNAEDMGQVVLASDSVTVTRVTGHHSNPTSSKRRPTRAASASCSSRSRPAAMEKRRNWSSSPPAVRRERG